MGGGEVYTRIWWGKPSEIGYLEDPGIEGRIIYYIIRKWDVGLWSRSIWIRIGTGGGHL